LPVCRRIQFQHRTHEYRRQPEQHRHFTSPRHRASAHRTNAPVLATTTRCRGREFRVPRRKILNHFLIGRLEPALAERITRRARFHAALRSSSALLASIQNRWIEPSSS
jgi:hypothetical protein